MKITVEKTSKGIRVDFEKDASAKPVTIVLDGAQVEDLIGLLERAKTALAQARLSDAGNSKITLEF